MSLTVEWSLRRVTQGDVHFYIGTSTISEIDAVARVPSFPSSLSDIDWAERVFQPNREDDQWQRPLDLDRMKDIARFSGGDRNWMMNSIMLYIPRAEHLGCSEDTVQFQENDDEATLRIDMKGFLSKDESGDLVNWKTIDDVEKDLRPLLLIDGQHRTRGAAANRFGKDKQVPIIVLPSVFNMSEVARVFTEINTEGHDLRKLHRLHLRHRFELYSRDGGSDFRQPRDVKFDAHKKRNCRANRMAYEVAARMCMDEDSPLRERIRMMEGSQGEITLNALEWLKVTKHWYMQGMPFEDMNLTLDEIVTIVKEYFTAFVEVTDHVDTGVEPWEDGRSRWSGRPKTYILHGKPFESLLYLFPLAHGIATRRHGKVGKDEFKLVLRPLSWLDWTEVTKLKRGYGVDKSTPDDLYIWMSWAIEDGRVHPKDEVQSKDSKLCLPGRGFFAPPNKDLLSIETSIESGSLWPVIGEFIHFFSQLPPNVNHLSRWQVRVDPGEPRPELKSPALGGGASLPIPVTEEIQEANLLEVTCFWSNRFGTESTVISHTQSFDGYVDGEDDDGDDGAPGGDDDETGGDGSPPQGEPGEGGPSGDEPVLYVASFEDDVEILSPPAKGRNRKSKWEYFVPKMNYVMYCSCTNGIDCGNSHCRFKTLDQHIEGWPDW